MSPTFEATLTLMLFRIIYIALVALKFGKSKPSRQLCLEIGKQIAALKFQKVVINASNR